MTEMLDPATFDRTDLVHLVEDNNDLPHDIIFHRLHFLACNQDSLAIKEPHLGLEKSFSELLSDIVTTRNSLKLSLSGHALELLHNDKEAPIIILARGYDFVVAYFAVLAMGGIAVPTSTQVTFDEALYFAKTCRAKGIVYSSMFSDLAYRLVEHPEWDGQCKPIRLSDWSSNGAIPPRSLKFFSGKTRDPNKPGHVIFTSGTTGRPKGVCYRRYNILAGALWQTWKDDHRKGYVMLQMLPTHHATGLSMNTIPILMAGGCVEFTRPQFDPSAIWDRIREGGVKLISAVPTIYIRLLRHWDDVLQSLPPARRAEYRDAMSAVEQFHCASAALPTKIAVRWKELCKGRHILERYGATEFGNPYANTASTPLVVGSAGILNPNVESFLSNGDEGEIFARSPLMFSKYINDIEATSAAHTSNGFFITGDEADKRGDYYFIKGRKSIDIMKSGGYKISALDIEKEMAKHPKISEAMVVGIDDEEYGQLIAAAVVLKPGIQSLTLRELRDDMRNSLSLYKLPTVLRVVPQLAETETYKVQKKKMKEVWLEGNHPDIQRWKSNRPRL